MNFIIHAPNVHTGGGKVLLNALLAGISDDLNVTLQCDARFQTDRSDLTIFHVKPTIFSRLLAEKRLKKLSHQKTTILCFGNLPPLFKMRSKVFLFLQSRYLIDKQCMQEFSLKTRCRIWFEKKWLKWRLKNVNQVIVQTPSMARLFVQKFRTCKSVTILPLVEAPVNFERAFHAEINQSATYDFVYLASGEPHKNHRRLIEAWKLLAEEAIFPSLCLSLNKNRDAELLRWIEKESIKHYLKIVNLEITSREEIEGVLRNSKALIFPSLLESFGLPLVEARETGLPIVASELDFVRDLVDPEETFDPSSSVSIARAVKRFVKKSETLLNFVDGKGFLKAIRKSI